MACILIVDDEEKIRRVIRVYAEKEGFDVLEATDGEDAIATFKKHDVDIIIMDIMMPKKDGFKAYEEIKEIEAVPIIILSARSEEIDKLYGFNIGIDDYVVKPFSANELMARVKAILNRSGYTEEGDAGLRIDEEGREVYVDGKRIDLTPKEFELLNFLYQHKGIAKSRNQILDAVWGYDFYGDDRTVDTHIKMLRQHLGNYKDHIKTIRGFGYKFE